MFTEARKSPRQREAMIDLENSYKTFVPGGKKSDEKFRMQLMPSCPEDREKVLLDTLEPLFWDNGPCERRCTRVVWRSDNLC